MQEIFDELSKGWRAQRSLSQMTLGRVISELEMFPQNTMIENICSPHSYRGYYSDLAFEHKSGERTVASLLTELKNECFGKTFMGYKGGDYYMNEHTPLWIADYGSCGVKIISIKIGDILSLEVAEDY